MSFSFLGKRANEVEQLSDEFYSRQKYNRELHEWAIVYRGDYHVGTVAYSVKFLQLRHFGSAIDCSRGRTWTFALISLLESFSKE
jgi:hypothetical protein